LWGLLLGRAVSKEFPEIGRFALRDMGTTIAAGIVKNITEKHDPNKK